jgi:hypothetical protein
VTTLRSLSVLALSFVFFGCAGVEAVGPGPGSFSGPVVAAADSPRTVAAPSKRPDEARARPALERPRFSSSVFALKAKGCR